MLGRDFEVRFTVGAERDLDKIFKYYSQSSESLSNRFLKVARERAQSLADFWAHELRKSGIRKLRVTGFPYHLFYRVDKNAQIIRIISI